MLSVDDVRQVSSIDLLLKDPHLDLVVEMLKVGDIATNDPCNS